MSARDDHPLIKPAIIAKCRMVELTEQHDAMCDEIDRLRAEVAAVNAALDQYDNSTGDWTEAIITCVDEIKKAVER